MLTVPNSDYNYGGTVSPIKDCSYKGGASQGVSHLDTLAVCSSWALSLSALEKYEDAATFQASSTRTPRVGGMFPRRIAVLKRDVRSPAHYHLY